MAGDGDNSNHSKSSPSDSSKPDISDPYFTHPSDHSGLVLISTVLDGNNHNGWKRAMLRALNSKNKIGFIDGTIEPPSKETDLDGYKTWSRINDLVQQWICNTVDAEIADSLNYCTSAQEVWDDLHERFSQGNASRIYEIQRDIALHKQEQQPVSAYYTKLKSFWDELISYSEAPQGSQGDQQKLMQFLMGLNDTYSAIRGQILLMKPLPTVRQAYAAVCQEEKQCLISVTHSPMESSGSAAMAVRNSNRPNSNPGRGNRLDRIDQTSRPPTQRKGSGIGRPHCTYCGNDGHWVQTCFELIGYPPGHPKAKQHPQNPKSTSHASHATGSKFPTANNASSVIHDGVGPSVTLSEAQFNQFLATISTLSPRSMDGSNSKVNTVTKPGLSKVTSPHWIIDSGATDHITSSSELLHKDNSCSLSPVLLPSGDKVNIDAKGSIPLNNVFYLHDVLSVPKFKVDLLSVSRMTRGMHCSVTFYPSWCILQDLATRRTIGLGEQRNGLYYLTALATEKSMTQSSPFTTKHACNLTITSTDLWHNRLGHVSSSCLGFLAKHFINFPFQSNKACHICPLAKQSRLPFYNSSISSARPFEMIHCDIWGRYRHSSLSGAHYFLTIVDDYSRFTWVFLMRHKGEVQTLIKNFFSYALTQFDSLIKIFRSDNGSEFMSLRSFFHDNGVIFHHSCVYTPQQNGVVERKHRHILQVARALKFQAHLTPTFWGECVLTAVHIINRLPTPLLSFKTPFELLYSKPHTFSHLRVFGCLAYATNVHPSHKFDRRAIRSIFIGYPIGQKAFKLYDLSTKKVFTSRDVKFHKHIFPYADITLLGQQPHPIYVPAQSPDFFSFDLASTHPEPP